jgi:predicted DNA-binding transcriptional regulator AlpA
MTEAAVRYATLEEIAKRWGLKRSWLYEKSRKDELPGQFRLGRQIRIDIEAFDRGAKEGLLG